MFTVPDQFVKKGLDFRGRKDPGKAAGGEMATAKPLSGAGSSEICEIFHEGFPWVAADGMGNSGPVSEDAAGNQPMGAPAEFQLTLSMDHIFNGIEGKGVPPDGVIGCAVLQATANDGHSGCARRLEIEIKPPRTGDLRRKKVRRRAVFRFHFKSILDMLWSKVGISKCKRQVRIFTNNETPG